MVYTQLSSIIINLEKKEKKGKKQKQKTKKTKDEKKKQTKKRRRTEWTGVLLMLKLPQLFDRRTNHHY